MAGYLHGIQSTETPAVEPLVLSENGIQLVVGAAPIHLIKKPSEAVNKLIICYSLDEVKEKIGYNDDFSFNINELTFATFELVKVAPVIYVNVLDPEIHFTQKEDEELTLTRSGVALLSKSVLLDSVKVTSEDGTKTYEKDVDYTVSYDGLNVPMLYAVKTSENLTATSKVKVSYKELDPSQITPSQIVGGYDAETGIATGLELIRQAYPVFAKRVDIIVSPGYSKNPVIAAILEAKTEKVNNVFNASTYIDVDTKSAKNYESAVIWKDENYIRDKRSNVEWPMFKRDGKIMHLSAYKAALRSRMTADDGLPYRSTSNKRLLIDDLVLEDGTPVVLEMPQANVLNENGINTVILWGGNYKSWGNNTAIYPESKASQYRFAAVRDSLDWLANTFIEMYFDKVDEPTNLRLVESVVDEENARMATLTAKGKMAGGEMKFLRSDNPIANILNGHIKFSRRVAFFSPAEFINEEVTFDPTFIESALFGGES